MRYRCVDAQKAAGFPVAAACQAAGVTRSAWYAWAARAAQGPPQRQREEARLVGEIRRIHTRSGGTYGVPRVHAELGRRGWMVNHKRVERLMRTHGIVGYRPRRRRSLTRQDHAAPPAPDLLGRLFDPERPDVAWCGDVTWIPTDEAGCTWHRSSTWPPDTCWATRWPPATMPAWSPGHWRLPSRPAAGSRWPTRSSTATGAANLGSRGRRNTASLDGE
jgi:hypothetical protein